MTPDPTPVESMIERHKAAVADLRRLYGFSDSEAGHFLGLYGEADPEDHKK